MFEAFWAHTKIPVIVLLIIIKKFTKKISPFTSFFPFFLSSFLTKSVFFGFCFLPDAFYIDVEPKLMMSEAVNDVCMSSLCFHKRSFSSKFGDNIVWWEWVGDRNLLGDIKISPRKCCYRLGIKVAIVLISISKKVSHGGNQALIGIFPEFT